MCACASDFHGTSSTSMIDCCEELERTVTSAAQRERTERDNKGICHKVSRGQNSEKTALLKTPTASPTPQSPSDGPVTNPRPHFADKILAKGAV